MSSETHGNTERMFGSGSGTHLAYCVEVRSVLSSPFTFPETDFIVTSEWRRFPARIVHCDIHPKHFHGAEVYGIPVQNYLCRQADELNLMDFDAAYTFACVLQTKASSGLNGNSLYARLVEVEVKYSWSAQATKETQTISLHELRRSVNFNDVSNKADNK